MQERLARIAAVVLHFDIKTDYLGQHLLTLAYIEEVKKIRYRFGIVRAGTAAYHERHIIGAVCCAQRQAREIEHIEDIGIAHLILEGESDKIELRYRISALVRPERYLMLAHLLLHVHPRSIHTLTPDIILAVERTVKDADTEVRHSYLV